VKRNYLRIWNVALFKAVRTRYDPHERLLCSGDAREGLTTRRETNTATELVKRERQDRGTVQKKIGTFVEPIIPALYCPERALQDDLFSY
jgi:hypothetical protein